MKYGMQRPTVVLGSGDLAIVPGVEADTNRNILAVAGSSDQGIYTVFGPNGAFMTKVPIAQPTKSEAPVRDGNHYFLEVTECKGDGSQCYVDCTHR